MFAADCCNNVESCCDRFCKRSRPASSADAFTARYEAQVHAMMTVASSVPMRIGRRYLNEIFERDQRLRQLSVRSIETPFESCSRPWGNSDRKQICRRNGWALQGAYSIGRFGTHCREYREARKHLHTENRISEFVRSRGSFASKSPKNYF